MHSRVTSIALALFLLGIVACESATERRTDFAVQGIDVSHHQRHIQWDSVAKAGFAFAFVKATEGATHADSLFCHNWDELRRVGIRRGAYHFYRPNVPAELQARNFLNWVKPAYGDLPPVLDIEVLDGIATPHLLVELQTWLFLVEIHTGMKPIIYTNLKFYNKHLAGRFAAYPLWIARYSTRQPALACGREWAFWQYGNRGQAPGIEGPVDFNVFAGNLAALEALTLQPNVAFSQTR